MSPKLYGLPQIYDIAFSWDLSREIEFLKGVFERHVSFSVRKILEPACGSGRFLRTLPSHGFRVTGYDINPVMLKYAEDSVATAGCGGSVRIVLADMVSAEIPGEFDAAINLIGSIGYLHSDDGVISHLRATGSSLREGGIYLVQVNFAHEGELPDGDHWTMEREGISVKTSWRILREDRESRLSHQVGRFEVEQEGNIVKFDDRHTLRLWLYSELKELVHRSDMFEIAAVYGEDFEELKDRENLSGEHGNVYITLQRN